MDCREARLEIEALLDGEEVSAELQPHLAACAVCAREMEEKRAFFGSLRGSVDRALDGVESTPAERAALAARLSVRRPAVLPRVAAAIVVALTLGIVATALGLFGRRTADAAEVKDLADKVAERKSVELRTDALLKELDQYAKEIKGRMPRDPDDNPAGPVMILDISDYESQLDQVVSDTSTPSPTDAQSLARNLCSDDPKTRARALRGIRTLKPETFSELDKELAKVRLKDRWVLPIINWVRCKPGANPAPTGQIHITQVTNGRKFEFKQSGDAGIVIYIEEQPGAAPITIHAQSMGDLQKNNAAVCKQWNIEGTDGWVKIGQNEATTGFDDRLGMVFWKPEETSLQRLRMEAYARALAQKSGKRENIEAKWRDLEKKMAEAEKGEFDFSVTRAVDLDLALREVRRMNEAQRRAAREQVEKDLENLKGKLRSLDALRGRLNGLKVYVDEVNKLKD